MDKLEQYKIEFMLDNKVWSFSSINCYENCHRCFYLSYLQDPPIEKENNAFAQWGTLGHSLFERYANGALDFYELATAYESEYYEKVNVMFPPNKYVDLNSSYHDRGLEYFEKFEGFPDNWDIVDSEREIHLDINGNSFVGFIDLIAKDKNTGKYIIIDHKSKSKFNNEKEKAEYARQLYLYSLYIKNEFKAFPSHLIFNMFRSDEIIVIDFNEDDLKQAVQWVTDTIDKIKKDASFTDKITLQYEKKNKSLDEFKNDDYFCNNLCGARKYCLRSNSYIG